MHTHTHQFFSLNNNPPISLHSWLPQSPEKKNIPILALHGFTGCAEDFALLAKQPEFAHTPIFAPDLPGHSQSSALDDPLSYALETSFKAINVITQKLMPNGFHLLGYSMGGRLALHYVLSNKPENLKKLILISTSPGIESKSERSERHQEDKKNANRILSGGTAAFIESWQRLPLIITQKQNIPHSDYQEILARKQKQNPTGLANSLLYMGAGALPEAWNRLKEINTPTLLLTGELDSKYCNLMQKMHPLIAQSQLTILPTLGHCTHLENAPQSAKIIQSFLDPSE